MKKSSLMKITLISTGMLILAWCTTQQISVDSDVINISTGATSSRPTSPTPSAEGKALNIVTTFAPLYAHTANIVDANDTLTNLVPPGTSVHFWQPKPSDVLAMEQADVIITNWLWLEEFLDDYLTSLKSKWIQVIDTSIWVETMEFSEHKEEGHEEDEKDAHDEHSDHQEHDDHDDYAEHEDEGDEGHEDAHHHEWLDPHIRLGINNALIQTNNISTSLAALDPSQVEVYKNNAATYTQTLQELDRSITAQISSKDTQPFVVFHDAYQYFLHRYDLETSQVWLVQEFHGDNPSQKQIAELIATIQNEWVQTLYTEPQFNPSIIQRLKQETGVSTQEIDPIGSKLSKDGYVDNMKNLAKSFVDA